MLLFKREAQHCESAQKCRLSKCLSEIFYIVVHRFASKHASSARHVCRHNKWKFLSVSLQGGGA